MPHAAMSHVHQDKSFKHQLDDTLHRRHGMQAFGEDAGENIFIGTLRGPKWMLALADACVVANLLGQWQVRCLCHGAAPGTTHRSSTCE